MTYDKYRFSACLSKNEKTYFETNIERKKLEN